MRNGYLRDLCFFILTNRNFAVDEKWLSAKFDSVYIQREISHLMRNGYLRDLCFFILTNRNFAVNEKWLSARFQSFTINREKFRSKG